MRLATTDEANALLESDPLALLTGMLLEQHIATRVVAPHIKTGSVGLAC